MRVGESSVLTDIPFQHLFHVDPYHMFAPRSTSTWYQNEPPSVRRAQQPQEYIIPIQIEGRESLSRSSPIPIDLTDDISRNVNNNGLHSNSRNRRRQGNSSKSGDGSSTTIPISRQMQHTVKDMFSNAARTPPSTSESCLPDEIIDLCMYEDMSDSDVCISDSYDDKLYLAASSSSKTKPEGDKARKHRPNTRKFNPTPSYPVYKHLKTQLAADGRQIDYIRGDGNCFFRALSKEIYDSEEFHDDVRQAVVDLMEKYSKEFEQFLDSGMPVADHIKEMRKTSTWASSAEIYAAATLLQREVYVLSPNHSGTTYNWMQFKPRFTYTKDTSYHPCFITLCHTHGNHYDRIAPDHGGCNCDFDPPALSGVQAYVDLTDKDCETV